MDSSTSALEPGALLNHGTYRIERILGRGGFGITYLASDTSLDRKVAVKEFFPKDYCDREGSTSHVTLGTQNTAEFVNRLKAKFLKEARNIARLEFPGIIRIYAAFEENNTAYYVMEYIEGATLSEMVKKSGPLPMEKALGYVEKVGEALSFIHAHKVNHLDVKPANIIVRASDDEPILIDFGLSKQYDREGNQTSTTPTGISHGYAPLEQYRAEGLKEFSPQTDLYSLAATLYFLLTGNVPPQATDLADEELKFPASVPPHIAEAIAKAMSSGRKQRHESVNAFIADLKKGDSIKTADDDEATQLIPEKSATPEKHIAPPPVAVAASEETPVKAEESVEETYQPQREKSSRALRIGIGIAAVVAVVLAVGIFFILRDSGDKTSKKTDTDPVSSLFSTNSANEEDIPAAEELFNMGVEAYQNKNYDEAKKYWLMAAEQGDIEAQNNLGFMFYNGNGVQKDYTEAARYWRLSAEQGNAEAQYNLASSYENGEGVPTDFAEALKWYKKSAEQGYASAQYALGCIYSNGDFVPRNMSEAVKWWKKAEAQGNEDAERELKRLRPA